MYEFIHFIKHEIKTSRMKQKITQERILQENFI